MPVTPSSSRARSSATSLPLQAAERSSSTGRAEPDRRGAFTGERITVDWVEPGTPCSSAYRRHRRPRQAPTHQHSEWYWKNDGLADDEIDGGATGRSRTGSRALAQDASVRAVTKRHPLVRDRRLESGRLDHLAGHRLRDPEDVGNG
jgi:hypothetical protein